MLRLYRCLIRSRLDYGSFIYASASKVLSITDPIHHSGIRLSTGASRTSRAESLYAESGEPALATRRQILLCNYAAKVSALQKHPSYGAIHRPSLERRLAPNTRTSRPAGIRYKELLASLHIATHIIPLKMSSIPSWDVIRPSCDTRLCVLPKACTSPDTYRRLFSEILSHYPGYSSFHIWVSDNGSTGCAFIFYAQASKFRLNPFSSIFSAELFALWKALEAVSYQPPGQFLLCTYSLSAI
jgi:hypothetical protein